ncbi:MAG: GNAT family N-acetyltransferase [Daejeonella sp.]
MEFIIRKCCESDLDRLVELCKNHADYEQAAYQAQGKKELLKEAIFSEHNRLNCFIIEVDQSVAGYFTYTFDFSTWDARQFLYLDCLYLEPACRSLGIGAKVFTELEKIAKENKCVNIQWQTPVFNERAIKFYHKIGGIGKDKVRFFLNT